MGRRGYWLGLVVLGGSGAAGMLNSEAERDAVLRPALAAEVDSAGIARLRLTGLGRGLERHLSALHLDPGEGERFLALRTGDSPVAVAGQYRVMERGIEFISAFPLVPGLHYSASAVPAQLYAIAGMKLDADPGSITRSLELHRLVTPRQTEVVAVYPTATVVPANLLKFYIEFSRPMREGDAANAITLVDPAGTAVPASFLGLETELWDADHRRLTVFLDPGRIKRGLRPNSELGPALVTGRQYRLRISPGWRDAEGAELRSGYEKKFVAGPADRSMLDLSHWRVSSPGPGTNEPVVIQLPAPLDHALLQRMIRLTGPDGERVMTTVSSADEERTVHMIPRGPWVRGAYRIAIDTRLEDLAGNTFQRPFDLDLTEPGVRARDGLSVLYLQFQVIHAATPVSPSVHGP